ncbi:MAG: alpha-galactosidase [Clostridia bacterium]|nr:alpha-galactosidase [Clostridia bacterium]
MKSLHKITGKDMAMISGLMKFSSAENVPIEFQYGERTVSGIPEDFAPSVSYRMLTANTVQYIIEGTDAHGLNIRAEYIEYRDFPVTEWVFYFTNKGECDTPVLKNIRIEGEISCPSAVLEYGNGDDRKESGYHFFEKTVDEEIRLTPTTGTSCEGAFPYMTLHGSDREVRAAIGWPGKWSARIAPGENGVTFSCGQDRCATLLHPGETYRTPRLNLMAYTNEDAPFRGINIWRHWYFKHILPKENGQPIPPKLCLHYFEADGKPEFTGASEENQVHALEEYLRRDMKPDIWWIDAGWYPCDYEWHKTGSWYPDPARFPNGLSPIGEACEKNGVQLLLWFEPERVWRGEALDREHPEWLLKKKGEEDPRRPYKLLNLANKDALAWLIERVDSIIKDSHVKIYRQDFNMDPLPIWIDNESEDRIGMTENLHVQGYLAYWDALILKNPGLWIDSCASGGRRNDLETMRRAVTLHYTDVGYGHHPIKQKQHREMFEWIPYFRAHNMSWDNPETGTYESKKQRPADEFSFHCALTPSLTSLYTYDDTEEHFEIGRKMNAIWREAAELELSGDYYPISECRCDAHDWYSMQFDNPVEQKGFLQAIRNTLSEDGTYTLIPPCVHEGKTYILTDRESGNTLTLTAETFAKGIEIALPKRSGIVYFYEYK